MNIKGIYNISKDEFIHIYQVHVNYKFKLRRSLYMSVGLFAFGLAMEYGVGMDFSFINTLVFWIMIAAFVINMLSDFVLPKTAYKNMLASGMTEGFIEMNDNYLCIGKNSSQSLKKDWNDFDSCIECDEAFLLYKRDSFTILVKSIIQEDMDVVRSFLKNKVNKQNNILYKR